MNLKQLESFVLVAEEKNFTKAAKQLFMTQPAISFQIKSLEENLGASLFERLDKCVELTDVGNILYPEAKKMLASYERVKEAIAELKGLQKGSLVIGASTIPGEYILPRLIGQFNQQYPEIEVALKIGSTSVIVDMLLERQINMGIIGAMIKHPSLTTHSLLEDELILIAATEHPITQLEKIKVRDIIQFPMLMRERGSGTRMVVEEHLMGHDIQPSELKGVVEFGSTRSIISGVEAGLGISFVSRCAAQGALRLGVIKEIALVDFQIKRKLYLITNRLKYRGIVAKAFLDFLSTATQEQFK